MPANRVYIKGHNCCTFLVLCVDRQNSNFNDRYIAASKWVLQMQLMTYVGCDFLMQGIPSLMILPA